MSVDLYDAITMTGLLLLGWAVWAELGASGIVGYVGGILIVVGILAAYGQQGK